MLTRDDTWDGVSPNCQLKYLLAPRSFGESNTPEGGHALRRHYHAAPCRVALPLHAETCSRFIHLCAQHTTLLQASRKDSNFYSIAKENNAVILNIFLYKEKFFFLGMKYKINGKNKLCSNQITNESLSEQHGSRGAVRQVSPFMATKDSRAEEEEKKKSIELPLERGEGKACNKSKKEEKKKG